MSAEFNRIVEIFIYNPLSVKAMNWPVLVIVGTQLLFTTSDLMGRTYMPRYGFTLAAFASAWFWIYFAIRNLAMFGQLYVFSTIELGKAMALFGAVSIVLANLLGYLLLKEILSASMYVGISLAIIAFIILAFS